MLSDRLHSGNDSCDRVPFLKKRSLVIQNKYDYSKGPKMTITRNESSSEHGVMMRLLRQLLFFGLLFEGLGMLSLKVLLAIVAVCLAIVMCTHFVCSRDVNSA